MRMIPSASEPHFGLPSLSLSLSLPSPAKTHDGEGDPQRPLPHRAPAQHAANLTLPVRSLATPSPQLSSLCTLHSAFLPSFRPSVHQTNHEQTCSVGCQTRMIEVQERKTASEKKEEASAPSIIIFLFFRFSSSVIMFGIRDPYAERRTDIFGCAALRAPTGDGR